MAGRTVLFASVAVIVLLAVGVAAVIYLLPPASSPTSTGTSTGVVQVVAAENFWGSLASQLGGVHVHVTSIVTDPNADPHSYETSTQNAAAVANAKFVIMNGAGYDVWMGKLINASSAPGQTVLNVAKLLGYVPGDLPRFSNEHFWYSPVFVNKTVNAIYKDYVGIDSSHAADYQANYKALNASLHGYTALEASIKAHFGGTKVASTETIFLYMANATGLNVVSPFEFMKAVAEGNDPSAKDVATFQQLLQEQPSVVKIFVYNSQTISPTTDNLKQLAISNNVPVVAITETLQPLNATFQDWMMAEATNVQNALNGHQ